jgi:hypothetical protein
VNAELNPDIVNERRVANRFCELVHPSLDHPEMPWTDPRDPDYEPPLRGQHMFATRDDVAGRADPALCKGLVGSLDQHWPLFDTINRERRAGVFMAFNPAEAAVATFIGEPTRGFHAAPSFIVNCGNSAGPVPGVLEQYVWLVDTGRFGNEGLTARDLADIAAMLRTAHGARDVVTTGEALVRVPGFHTRWGHNGGGRMVQFWLPPENEGKVPRYRPAFLHRTFLGLPVEAEAEGAQ